MIDAAVLAGRRPGKGRRVTSAVVDLVLAEVGTTFDRWVVLNAVASRSFPAQVGLLVPALSAALEATEGTVRRMLDDAESGHHLRVVSAPNGDPSAARVEMTAEGEVLHERVRAAVDELTLKLSAGLGVRFGR